MSILKKMLKKLVIQLKKMLNEIKKACGEIIGKTYDKNDFPQEKKFYPVYSGQGSAINYLNLREEKKSKENAKNDVNFAEKSVKELFPYFLKYILKMQYNGLYESTDKIVYEEMGLSSEDKANRLKNRAIKEKMLVTTMKKSVFEVNEENIRKYLENN